MTFPTFGSLFAAMDATWPAARFVEQGPWLLREGQGGGQRVSAATALGPVSRADVAQAENAMRVFSQAPAFQIRPEDKDLDALLAARGYITLDPVLIYVGLVADIVAETRRSNTVMSTWPPLAIQRELWHSGGIGPARLAVMDRAQSPKAAFLGRTKDKAAGVAFAAKHDQMAMLHAIEVHPEFRRAGVGSQILTEIAFWAQDHECIYLSLAVTKENFAANALYVKKKMSVVTGYHYRRKQKEQVN